MTIEQARGSLDHTRGHVKGSASHVAGSPKTQADGLIDQGTGAVIKAYGQAKEGLRDALDAGSDFIGDMTRAGGQLYRDGGTAVTRHVREQPLAACLVAGTVGFVLARLLPRH